MEKLSIFLKFQSFFFCSRVLVYTEITTAFVILVRLKTVKTLIAIFLRTKIILFILLHLYLLPRQIDNLYKICLLNKPQEMSHFDVVVLKTSDLSP